MRLKNIEILFFDFDLTLVDTRKVEKKLYRLVSSIGYKKPTRKGFKKHMGRKFSEVIQEAYEQSKIPKKVLIDAHRIFMKFNLRDTKSFSKGLFTNLKGKKIIILSNGDKEIVKMVAKYHKIHYDILLADQDMKKNERKHDLILKTLKKLKIPKKNSVYIGDHIQDIVEAHKAGIKVIAVPTGVFDKSHLKKYHPEIVLSKLNNLYKVI